MKTKLIPVLLLAVQAVFSCCAASQAASPARMPVKVVSLVGSNLNSVVFVTVDSKPITAEDVRKAVLVFDKTAALSSRTKSRPPLEGRRANGMAMRIAPQLVSSAIFENELIRRGVKATPESDSALLASYNKKFRKSAKTLDELAAFFGDLKADFKKQFARESRNRAFFAQEKILSVEDKELDRYYRSLTNQLKRSVRINKAASNRLEKAWAELNAGASWESVATNYTEDAILDPSLADNWKDWMSLDVNKIEPMDLRAAVLKLKVGGYTKPIETEEGLIIAKLLSKDGDFCNLARILVRMGVAVEFPDRKDAVKKLLRDKNHALQRRFLSDARKNAKLEFPYGKKFVFKIWEDSDPVHKKKNMK